MATLISGTVDASIDASSGPITFYSKSACLSQDGATVYFGGTLIAPIGAIFKCAVADFGNAGLVELYPADFMGTAIEAIWTDETKIYAMQAAGFSAIRSALLDGSSLSATVESASIYVTGSANLFIKKYGNKFLMGGKSYRGIAELVPSDDVYVYRTCIPFVDAVGPCEFESESLIVAFEESTNKYISVYGIQNGHFRFIAGNGTIGAIIEGGAYDSPVGGSINYVSSDQDGRVYFRNDGKIYSIVSGEIARVGLIGSANVMIHSPQLNKIISGFGNNWDLLS